MDVPATKPPTTVAAVIKFIGLVNQAILFNPKLRLSADQREELSAASNEAAHAIGEIQGQLYKSALERGRFARLVAQAPERPVPKRLEDHWREHPDCTESCCLPRNKPGSLFAAWRKVCTAAGMSPRGFNQRAVKELVHRAGDFSRAITLLKSYVSKCAQFSRTPQAVELLLEVTKENPHGPDGGGGGSAALPRKSEDPAGEGQAGEVLGSDEHGALLGVRSTEEDHNSAGTLAAVFQLRKSPVDRLESAIEIPQPPLGRGRNPLGDVLQPGRRCDDSAHLGVVQIEDFAHPVQTDLFLHVDPPSGAALALTCGSSERSRHPDLNRRPADYESPAPALRCDRCGARPLPSVRARPGETHFRFVRRSSRCARAYTCGIWVEVRAAAGGAP